MGRRFKELRAHLEVQAQQRQREIDAIRKYNKRLQSGMHYLTHICIFQT
jgi:endonuclease/exonuclease/phosphatase family metal-dependent hydrolase